MPVHPPAIVDASAKIAETAIAGPYCVIGADVEIGARTELKSHICVEGPIRIGEDNIFFPYSSIGGEPQDLKYHGERTRTQIGDRNKIHEFVTIHRGTEGGGGVTRIGDDNLLQAYVHVAHDVQVGNNAMLGHAVTFAGHVKVCDWAWIGAYTGVHQFCTIGRHSFVGGYSVVTQDVMPFSNIVSERIIKTFGANKVGLERRGFSKEAVDNLQAARRLLTHAKLNTSQALEKIRTELPPCAEIDELIEFIRASQRGVVK